VTTTPRNPGQRLAELAATDGALVALTVVAVDGTAHQVTRAELHAWSDAVAAQLQERGVDAEATVVVGLANSLEHVVTTWAAWKLGAMVLPLSPRLPARERDELLALARPTVVVASWPDLDGVRPEEVTARRGVRTRPIDYVTPQPAKCIGSGGSTGRPKLIVDPSPMERVPGTAIGHLGERVGFAGARSQIVPGPLYHNMPFTWGSHGLFEGQHVVLLERFDARLLVNTVAHYGIEFMTVVPTMMQRVADLGDVEPAELSSLRGVLHSASPCPPALKRAWLDLVDPTVLHEAFGATEAVGMTLIRGDEWLLRPGSVGRGFETDIRVLEPDGSVAPPGVVGEVYMRRQVPASYAYVGAEPAATTPDGFVSVGDLGYLDQDGYLFHADRRVDLIVTGGSNVYPAEVEAALLEHAQVRDAVVIGVPDESWGRRVHAIVEPADGRPAPTDEELGAHCRERLVAYKVPKSFELVARVPRDESGKVRRRALVEARS
jgi:bile acid-coenzyme A ligase